MLQVKLMVPAVVTPALLYLSSIVRSHTLARGLASLAVTAVVSAPCLLAILAANMLAFVLPEIETTYMFRPIASDGIWIKSLG